MDILSRILEARKARIADAKSLCSISSVREQAFQARQTAQPHAFAKALSHLSTVNVIAEIKRRSPSRGELKTGANPQAMAVAYEAGGAAAISVLTEEDFFGGSLNDLKLVRQTVSLPILRKDFVIDDYQVYESAAWGADAVLLIVAALDDESLVRLRCIAEDELGLDTLIEVHDHEEMERASRAGARLIGVNNRNLSTFEVSLDTSAQLAPLAPEGALLISESGIKSADDIRRLQQVGYRGFLIGETLMTTSDPVRALKEIRGQSDAANI